MAEARRRCSGSQPDVTSRTAARSIASAACRWGSSHRKRTSTPHSWRLRTCAPPSDRAPRISTRWPPSSQPWSMPAVPQTLCTPSCSIASTRSAGTRWTCASMRRCRGSASRAASGRSRRRRCPAASRRGRRWPASSSPTPTCSCSTSRRTISISTRSSGSRCISSADLARCWWRRTTGHSSTRR